MAFCVSEFLGHGDEKGLLVPHSGNGAAMWVRCLGGSRPGLSDAS